MAVPKKKSSPSRQGMRWSHIKASVDQMAICGHCGEFHRPHHLCTHCGHYNGRQVIVTRKEKRRLRQEQSSTEE